MKIDAHQHFWSYNAKTYPWIDGNMKLLQRDYLPHDLHSVLKSINIDGCVAVQASQTELETEFLLQCSEKNAFIKGVVGWVDLCDSNVSSRLRYFCKNPKFKGVRHILQDEPADFMNQKSFLNGITELSRYGLSYDILIYPHQLRHAIDLVTKFSNQPFVLNHLAKPDIKGATSINWKQNIKILAKFDNVHCKISGLVTVADFHNWTENHFRPYLDVVFEAFGTDRLMYGSDWPVCLLAATYEQVYGIIDKYIDNQSIEAKSQIFGKNAQRFYKLEN